MSVLEFMIPITSRISCYIFLLHRRRSLLYAFTFPFPLPFLIFATITDIYFIDVSNLVILSHSLYEYQESLRDKLREAMTWRTANISGFSSVFNNRSSAPFSLWTFCGSFPLAFALYSQHRKAVTIEAGYRFGQVVLFYVCLSVHRICVEKKTI